MGCQGSVATVDTAEIKEQDAMVTKTEKMVADRIKELCVPDNTRAIRISNRGSGPFCEGDRVVASFPGVHGPAWNHLMRNCNQMDGIKSSCVFLASKESTGFGLHTSMTKAAGVCDCIHLYDGKQQEFGCKWWELWKRRTDSAAQLGCTLFVVTKRDGSLGRSQRLEVRYLKDQRYDYNTMTIEEFVSMVVEPVVAPFREKYSVRSNTSTLGELPAKGTLSRRSSMGRLERSSSKSSVLERSNSKSSVVDSRSSSKSSVVERNSSKQSVITPRQSTATDAVKPAPQRASSKSASSKDGGDMSRESTRDTEMVPPPPAPYYPSQTSRSSTKSTTG